MHCSHSFKNCIFYIFQICLCNIEIVFIYCGEFGIPMTSFMTLLVLWLQWRNCIYFPGLEAFWWIFMLQACLACHPKEILLSLTCKWPLCVNFIIAFPTNCLFCSASIYFMAALIPYCLCCLDQVSWSALLENRIFRFL